MEGEVLAVQRMTEELRSSGMDASQASATVRAIAEGLETFGVTRAVLKTELKAELKAELAPITLFQSRPTRMPQDGLATSTDRNHRVESNGWNWIDNWRRLCHSGIGWNWRHKWRTSEPMH